MVCTASSGMKLVQVTGDDARAFLHGQFTNDIENLRPGILERLGFAPDVLLARNPKLVITRITGFGQTGPYASRPGFASIAESMGGVAAISGQPGGEPMLPAFALTDEVTGLVGAFATMVALHSGKGQVVDVREKPIPGLFAAGELVGGIFYNNYPGGSGLTNGAVFGRTAGESAGAYVTGK